MAAHKRQWDYVRCAGAGEPHRGTASTAVHVEQPVGVGGAASTEVGQDELVPGFGFPRQPSPLASRAGGSTEIACGRGHARRRQADSLIDR